MKLSSQSLEFFEHYIFLASQVLYLSTSLFEGNAKLRFDLIRLNNRLLVSEAQWLFLLPSAGLGSNFCLVNPLQCKKCCCILT